MVQSSKQSCSFGHSLPAQLDGVLPVHPHCHSRDSGRLGGRRLHRLAGSMNQSFSTQARRQHRFRKVDCSQTQSDTPDLSISPACPTTIRRDLSTQELAMTIFGVRPGRLHPKRVHEAETASQERSCGASTGSPVVQGCGSIRRF